jgi:fructose-1,6-bisphosphatase/sedoheptulose 1,7-bisphosphatase-like protein
VSKSLKKLDGLDPDVVDRLRAAGIRTSDKLLEMTKSAKDREALSQKTGITPRELLRFANLADKLRVKGLGAGYAELLCRVGVDTVRELKYRNPAKLAAAMRQENEQRKLVRLVPTEKAVGRWVEAAKKLPPKITYR